MIAHGIAREQDEMVVRLPPGRRARALAPITRSNVGFDSDDRLYLRALRLLLEIPGGVQVPVVRDGESGLLQLLRAPNQIVDPVRSVK